MGLMKVWALGLHWLKGVALACVLGLSVAVPAQAATFTLSGAFTDGGILSGTFDFDQTCAGVCDASAFSNLNVTTTDGFFVQGATYNGPATILSSTFSLGLFDGTSVLGLIFSSLKDMSGGDSIAFVGFEFGPGTLWSETKRFVGGEIALAPVPIPLPLLLFASGLGLLGLLARRGRRQHARIAQPLKAC
jgi:hypothetical protein